MNTQSNSKRILPAELVGIMLVIYHMINSYGMVTQEKTRIQITIKKKKPNLSGHYILFTVFYGL